MVVSISLDELDDAIQDALSEYSTALNGKLNTNLKDVADKTVETLKQGGPYKERTGKYTPDWTVTARKQASVLSTDEYSVHNKKHYQIAHLLEHGHVTRNGGRTKSYEHILPAQEAAEELAMTAVEKAVQEANGSV